MKKRTSASAGRPRNLEEMLLLQSVKYMSNGFIHRTVLSLDIKRCKNHNLKAKWNNQVFKIKPLNRVQVRSDTIIISYQQNSKVNFCYRSFFNPKKYVSSHYLIFYKVLNLFFNLKIYLLIFFLLKLSQSVIKYMYSTLSEQAGSHRHYRYDSKGATQSIVHFCCF